ncbi:hypothetical protein [Rosistilla carotiformis]|nr:hypothetical protein [Rosistilla carotiformis]
MTTTTLTQRTESSPIDASEDYLMDSENAWGELIVQLTRRQTSRRKLKADPVWEMFFELPPSAGNADGDTALADAAAVLVAAAKGNEDAAKPADFDWSAAAAALSGSAPTESDLLTWAYVLPLLADTLGEAQWWEVLGVLKSARQAALTDLPVESSRRVILAAELGLVLAWGLKNFQTSVRLAESSWSVYCEYLECEDDRLQELLSGGAQRLPKALASALRSMQIARVGFKHKPANEQLGELNEMAAWQSHLVRWDGSLCLQPMETKLSSDLLDTATRLLKDPGLRMAYDFACRTADKALKNKLTTEIELPESGMYCDSAGLVSMRPSWFRHHGWIVADFYSQPAPRIELSAGKRMILEGAWEATIQIDGQDCQPRGDWEEVCWHSDDDVHYIEMEQCWTHGVTLQRQLMVVREDGAVLLADTVLSPDDSEIFYRSSVPLAATMQAAADAETREVVLHDNKPRAMVLPIGLSEWRVGRSPGKMEVAEGRLTVSGRGEKRLYVPVWIDLERRRFDRPRTWRNLTVASRLVIAKANEAVASRVQFGSEQWIVFRSLSEHKAYTFCGKHLAADFYCGRFDPSDGSLEDLITVENASDSQDGNA